MQHVFQFKTAIILSAVLNTVLVNKTAILTRFYLLMKLGTLLRGQLIVLCCE
jgi:hypothetical protein